VPACASCLAALRAFLGYPGIPTGFRSNLSAPHMEDHEVAFYQGLARQHRGTSRQVGAWSEQSQTARFDVMFDVLDSLLCGKGDLVAYLDRHGRLDTLRYIGIDGIEENVEDARRLGGYDFRLVRWNGVGRVVDEPVDVIVFSGTFATTCIDRRLAMYGSLLAQARVGVVGNFLTSTPGVKDYGEGMVLMDSRRRASCRGSGGLPGADPRRLPAPRLHRGRHPLGVLASTFARFSPISSR
jgi:hypothetical protein